MNHGKPDLAERARRVSDLVEMALECDPDQWSRLLNERCGDDAALRAEAESLLGYQDRAAEFIEHPAYQAAAHSLAAGDAGELNAGDTVGGYKILSLLGEGGMGEVYLAEDALLGRKVAIKVVKRGFGRGNLIRHFRQEERILAGLNHPNIARLYGAITMEDGTPCFVMEYVEGERLEEYCELRRLGLKERLQLFRKLCTAVSYAHQHLVIHRDLKPGNIRVTGEGEPKLLDFGIAKLIDDNAGQEPNATITLARVMTPEYASPEQVRGDPMTTASDVYSLGVILYELLTGQKPYRLAGRSPDEVSRAVAEQQPTRPSVASAANPGSPAENRKSLRGDLDNIVLMAMRKEPQRRYISVGQFSEDIRRHLESLPVLAREDTWSYRSRKFIKRHTVGVAAAVLVALTLVAGILATAWQARRAENQRARAERRFQDVRQLANSLMFELHDAIENLPGSTAARVLLVRRALEYLDSLARESGEDPSLQRELAAAYLKVGNVQGNPTNANLGDSNGALQSYQKSLAITQKLLAQANDPQTKGSLALILRKVADVEANSNRVGDGVATARRSLAIFKGLADASPADSAAQMAVAIGHLKLGDILGNPNFLNLGDQAGALQNYDATLNILVSLHARSPSDAKTRRYLGMIHERIGAMRELQEDTRGALLEYQSSAAIRVPLAAEFPNETPIVRDAAIAYEKLGNAMAASGDWEAALENRHKALEIFRNLAEADPKDFAAQRSLAISYIHLGDLFGSPEGPNLGRQAEAIAAYQRANDLLTPHADGSDPSIQSRLSEVRDRLRKLQNGQEN